eukprot:871912-Heterocapsa_arctica.AAC.1
MGRPPRIRRAKPTREGHVEEDVDEGAQRAPEERVGRSRARSPPRRAPHIRRRRPGLALHRRR